MATETESDIRKNRGKQSHERPRRRYTGQEAWRAWRTNMNNLFSQRFGHMITIDTPKHDFNAS